jgi:DNA-binding transcriptional regulator YdaS (Cro superfamily)
MLAINFKNRTPGLIAAIKAAGGIRPLARALGISHVSVLEWTSVPTRHLLEIEKVTGIPRETLRPELYRKPRHP